MLKRTVSPPHPSWWQCTHSLCCACALSLQMMLYACCYPWACIAYGTGTVLLAVTCQPQLAVARYLLAKITICYATMVLHIVFIKLHTITNKYNFYFVTFTLESSVSITSSVHTPLLHWRLTSHICYFNGHLSCCILLLLTRVWWCCFVPLFFPNSWTGVKRERVWWAIYVLQQRVGVPELLC